MHGCHKHTVPLGCWSSGRDFGFIAAVLRGQEIIIVTAACDESFIPNFDKEVINVYCDQQGG
jgi:hypothetical protein